MRRHPQRPLRDADVRRHAAVRPEPAARRDAPAGRQLPGRAFPRGAGLPLPGPRRGRRGVPGRDAQPVRAPLAEQAGGVRPVLHGDAAPGGGHQHHRDGLRARRHLLQGRQRLRLGHLHRGPRPDHPRAHAPRAGVRRLREQEGRLLPRHGERRRERQGVEPQPGRAAHRHAERARGQGDLGGLRALRRVLCQRRHGPDGADLGRSGAEGAALPGPAPHRPGAARGVLRRQPHRLVRLGRQDPAALLREGRRPRADGAPHGPPGLRRAVLLLAGREAPGVGLAR